MKPTKDPRIKTLEYSLFNIVGQRTKYVLHYFQRGFAEEHKACGKLTPFDSFGKARAQAKKTILE